MSDKAPRRQSLLLPALLPLGALAVIALVLFGFSRILLGISHNAATVTACVVAASIVAVGAIVAGQRRVGPAAIGSLLGAVAGVALMTGSLAFLIVGPQKEEIEPAKVTLAAGPHASSEGFDQTSLTFPADVPVDLEFDNQETGVQHNVVIFKEDPAKVTDQTPLFHGALTTGPAVTPYAVPPVPEGSYFFHCEVHPTTMTGTITASAGGAAPGPTVVAKNIQFDTKEIDLPADAPTTQRGRRRHAQHRDLHRRHPEGGALHRREGHGSDRDEVRRGRAGRRLLLLPLRRPPDDERHREGRGRGRRRWRGRRWRRRERSAAELFVAADRDLDPSAIGRWWWRRARRGVDLGRGARVQHVDAVVPSRHAGHAHVR
jgi:plastocyanin